MSTAMVLDRRTTPDPNICRSLPAGFITAPRGCLNGAAVATLTGDADMKWKFWSKEDNAVAAKPAGAKHAKPQDLPQRVGQYMVTQLKEDPDTIWNYKAVLLRQEDSKARYWIRIFDPAAAKMRGVRVTEYNSLDTAADLVIYQGTFNKESGKVDISRPNQAPQAA